MAGVVFQAFRHSGTGLGGGAVRSWGHSTVSGPNPGRLEEPRAWLPLGCGTNSWILMPPRGTVPFPLPEGLSHSRALLFLLCDYVTSWGPLARGGPAWLYAGSTGPGALGQSGLCWGLSARDTTSHPGLPKAAGPRGWSHGDGAQGALQRPRPPSCWGWSWWVMQF